MVRYRGSAEVAEKQVRHGRAITAFALRQRVWKSTTSRVLIVLQRLEMLVEGLSLALLSASMQKLPLSLGHWRVSSERYVSVMRNPTFSVKFQCVAPCAMTLLRKPLCCRKRSRTFVKCCDTGLGNAGPCNCHLRAKRNVPVCNCRLGAMLTVYASS